MDQSKCRKVVSQIKSLFTKIASHCYKELPYITITIILLLLASPLTTFQDFIQAVGVPKVYYFTIGNHLILFLYAYIGAVIINYIKSKRLKLFCKIAFYFIIVLLFSITHFLSENFDLTINPTCLTLLAETTSQEATEFVNSYLTTKAFESTALQITLYTVIIIVAETIWHFAKSKTAWQFLQSKAKKLLTILNASLSVIISVVLFAGCTYAIYLSWEFIKIKSSEEFIYLAPPSDPITSIITSAMTLNITSNNISDAIILNESIAKGKESHVTTNDSLNIVVVIGESHIKHHSQLYGYSLNTNPLLSKEQKEERLFVFNDVITSSNYTSSAIKNILCCNNSCEGEYWHESPYFPTIFKSAGYDVYFWSNQQSYSNNSTFSFTLNSFLYNPSISEITYNMTNEKSYEYDGELIKSFNESIKLNASKHNLVLFHLMGQHHSVYQRYPNEDFSHFNADSIKRSESYLGNYEKEYIAGYDNATLYNDYVLNYIIETLKDSNSIMIYLSDHGEEVYDYGYKRGREYGPLTANKLKYQYEIPFMVWCSDSYKAKYPERVNAIKNAVNRPFISDNICNMLFNLGNIETPYYRDSLDLISPNYKSKKRIINNKYIYEDIRYSTGK